MPSPLSVSSLRLKSARVAEMLGLSILRGDGGTPPRCQCFRECRRTGKVACPRVRLPGKPSSRSDSRSHRRITPLVFLVDEYAEVADECLAVDIDCNLRNIQNKTDSRSSISVALPLSVISTGMPVGEVENALSGRCVVEAWPRYLPPAAHRFLRYGYKGLEVGVDI